MLIGTNPSAIEVAIARSSIAFGDFSTLDNRLDTAESRLLAAIAQGGPGHISYLISGGIVTWESGYTFRVSPAQYYILGVYHTSPETILTLSPASSSFDRIDAICVTASGTVIAITGEATAQPSEPDIDPSLYLEISFVFVGINSTQPSGVTSEKLYVNNSEWSTSVSNAAWNPNSTNNPRSATKDIEGTNTPNSSYVQLQRPSVSGGAFDINRFFSLTFFIRSKGSWNSGRTLTLTWYASGVKKGSSITLASGYWGFDSSNTTDYQLIAIPISNFVIPAGTLVNQLRIMDQGGSIGFYIDDISLNSNTSITVVQSIGISQTEADARYLQRANNLSDVASALSARINIGANDASNLTQGILPDARLANTGPGATGPVGDAGNIPVITIDSKGRITALTSVAGSGGAGGMGLTITVREVPSGAVNGVNTVFTTAYAPVNGSEQVFVNGQLLQVTTDYSISGNSITLNSAPSGSEIVLVTYIRSVTVTTPHGSTHGIAGSDPVSLDATQIVSGTLASARLADTGPGATGPVGNAAWIPVITIDAKGRVTALTSVAVSGTGTGTPSGPAGGDLTGTYPNPTLATIGSATGPVGNAGLIPIITIDAKGRVTALSSVAASGGGGSVVSYATTSSSGIVQLAPNAGTMAGTVVQANDSRLSDSRNPTGNAGGDLTGTYPNPTVAGLRGYSVNAAAPTTGYVLTYTGSGWIAQPNTYYSYVTREVPSGAVNGSNTVFVLNNTPISGTEQVFLDQGLQNVGVGNDYTISGRTITFTAAPLSGSILLVNYALYITQTPGHAASHGSAGGDPVNLDWSQINGVITNSKLVVNTPATGQSITYTSSGWAATNIYPFSAPVSTPLLSQFSWANQGPSTATDTPNGIYLYTPAATGTGSNVRMLVKSTPTPPYTITAAMLPMIPAYTYAEAGFVWRDSASNKAAAMAIYYDGTRLSITVSKFTTPTSFSANYTLSWPISSYRDHFAFGAAWVQLIDDNTNRKIRVSADGYNWQTILSVLRTDFLTPNQVGFFVDPDPSTGSGYETSTTLLSWKES